MNWIDLTAGVFLLIALFNGYRKGLVMQIVGLTTVILAAIFGGRLAELILPELNRLIDISPNVAHVLSYIFAFVAIAIVIFLIGKMIHKFINAVQLTFINRLLGGIVAMGTTMLFLSILLNLVLMLDPEERLIKKETKETSFFFERIESVVPAMVPYLNKEIWNQYIPEKYRKVIDEKSDSLKQYAPNNIQIDSTYQQKYFEID